MTDRLLPFDAPLERRKALHPKRIDLNLERMLRVCEALGNPQDRLPPTIHVAGTNGKGSPIALLRALAEVLQRVEDANAGQPLTFFESTTAAAFLAFSEAPADLLLLETGLGGALDATNIITRPRLTVIT